MNAVGTGKRPTHFVIVVDAAHSWHTKGSITLFNIGQKIRR